jgi:hypothetical protein
VLNVLEHHGRNDGTGIATCNAAAVTVDMAKPDTEGLILFSSKRKTRHDSFVCGF